MSIPSSFYLDPPNPALRPQPFPPKFIKRQIYNDPSVFKIIDDHSINEARTNYRNFKELMWNLVFKKHWNDLEKARAIFRWMTTKNLYTIMFDSELPGSPEQVLGAFKDGKTTYAKIFECLSSYAGLHCVTLSGWAKGVDYKPGMPITTTIPNHSWNAVFIDNNWQLVDCHWATRYLQSERNTPENLVYEYDDFYFLTEPSMLIYSHMPEEPQWQLLHPVRSRTEYEEYPLVKSFFFSIGMQFLQQNRGIVLTKKGVLTITLGFTYPTAFTFKLAYSENNSESLQGISLKRYVIQETTDNRVTFYFRSPREGNYYMTIFAQPVSDRIRIENVFKAACEYKIICDQAAPDVRPYPLCSDPNWGAGAPVRQYGLGPSIKTALISAPNGRTEIYFQKSRDVRIFARLVKDDMSEDVLENAVDLREQENQDIVSVVLPAPGEYGLEVYANEPVREGDTYTHVCQYLITFSDKDFVAMYGQVYDRSDLAYGSQINSLAYNAGPGGYSTLSGQGNAMYPPQGGPNSKYLQGGVGPAQDWESNQYGGGRGYRDELEGNQYSGTYKQAQNYDKKLPPSVAPKPGQKGIDGYPDSMNQAFQHQHFPGKNDYQGYNPSRNDYTYGPNKNQPAAPLQDDQSKKPLEIVYVTNITEKVANPNAGGSLRNSQESGLNEKNKKPIEIVYVPGGGSGIPDTSRTNLIGASKNPSGNLQDKGGYDDFPPPPPPTGSAIYQGNMGGNTQGKARPYGGQDNQSSFTTGQQKQFGGQDNQPDFANQQDGHQFKPTGGQNNFTSGLQINQKTPYGTGNHSNKGPKYGSGGQLLDSDSSKISGGKYGPGGQLVDTRRDGPTGGGRNQVQEQYDRNYGKQYHVPSYPFGGDATANNQFAPFGPSEPDQEYKPHPQKVYTSSVTMKAPASFKPIPLEQTVAPKPAPPEVPPKPFKDASIFENVDHHAVEVSKEEHKSFRDLVWHLIYAREITNELEKSRAIFLWLCSKDLTKLNFDSVQKGSPEEILGNLQIGQTTYAVVYEILCSYAGLHCKTISGYAKGAEYKPGMKFTGEQGQHSWNAVLVNGAWRLVDCHWAARRLVGKKVTAENVKYELDEYYFMPDPHQLIFTHFPDEVNWQLLERSISLADFENLVPVKSAFFKYGLQILGHREAVIRTKQEVTIRIGCPQFKMQSMAFTFTLSLDDGKEEYQGIKLNHFGMQEMVDNVSFFTIRPPDKGSYRLIIYAKDLDQQTKEGVYGGVCEYELICESYTGMPQPFPPCVHTSWGPGDSAVKYGLIALQKGAIFSTVQGLAEVRFQAPKELRYTAKLKNNNKDEKVLAGYVMHRVVGNIAVFTINAPFKGEFGLEIYVNDPECDGNSLYHAYQYLILCDESLNNVEPLPALPSGYLGPQPLFKKIGLTTSSHLDPYIQTDNGVLKVILTTAQPLRVTSQLIYVSGNRADAVSDYILQQSESNSVIFFIKLSKIGLYKFQIYALPYEDADENLPGVYNYLISCSNTRVDAIPYPKQYGQWKEGCYLFEPLEGNLPVKNKTVQHFKLIAPKANLIAAVVEQNWTHLDLNKATNAWEGDVDLSSYIGKNLKLALCANYGNVKSNYSTIIEYSID